jgi:alkaline phosphatase
MALKPGTGKVLAMCPEPAGGESMPYAIDAPEDFPTLADYTRKGIELLDGEAGFFMMVEGGKIDWACHANDAATTVHDVLAFDAAVAEAVKFQRQHPEETLIIVTADHGTGGMTVGFAGTGYNSRPALLKAQKMSYDAFDAAIKPLVREKASLRDALEPAARSFGLHVPGNDGEDGSPLALSAYEVQLLAEAWEATLAGREARARNPETYLLYGNYRPFTVTCTRILARKAGIAWTSYAHTADPVPLMALGAGAEAFTGYTPNTHVARKLSRLLGARE